MTREIIRESYQTGVRIERAGNIVHVDMIYPRLDGHADTVEVGLECVRAADSIRVTYDFDRDGYQILQASIFAWDAADTIMDAGWKEVAFIQSWALQQSDKDDA